MAWLYSSRLALPLLLSLALVACGDDVTCGDDVEGTPNGDGGSNVADGDDDKDLDENEDDDPNDPNHPGDETPPEPVSLDELFDEYAALACAFHVRCGAQYYEGYIATDEAKCVAYYQNTWVDVQKNLVDEGPARQ